ncbi:DUF2306 domain-containing protein [Roseicyclus marinus]|uniref:DUF2306 domain-containing protein n=1 Tax=Roseicyclus marinus TaxID=2161673 RepID=UPI0024104396|nr:DUF2306 domain-containing protein [Roseicyclus marinus]MDG3040546.1 DUF2306 domain-containing protein [Roseicyclus marinus]
MTATDLAALPLAVHLHLWPALCALVLGPFALYRRRRDIWHKASGYIWVGLMALTAASAFWIEAAILPIVLGFGLIHALSGLVLYGLWRGVSAARAGDVAAHSGWMRALYWQALIVAGSFTLLPGRTLNALLFPDRPILGVIAILGIGSVLVLRFFRLRSVRRAAG